MIWEGILVYLLMFHLVLIDLLSRNFINEVPTGFIDIIKRLSYF